jgi:hypothetical protein
VSVTVAVTVWLVPTLFVAVSGLSVTLVGVPPVHPVKLEVGPSSEK